jgi:hypothetical protein
MIPSGTYKAKAIDGVYGESKQKGTPFVRVSFKVTDGEHAGSIVGWDGYFTPNTQQRTIDSLRYCGCVFPKDSITDLTGLDANEVSVVVEHEDYTYPTDHEDAAKAGTTTTRARIAWVNSPGGIPEDQQMDDRKKAAFDARMKGAIAQVRAKSSSPNGPANRQAGGGGGGGLGGRPAASSKQQPDDFGSYGGGNGSDDDIPFVTSRANRFGL